MKKIMGQVTGKVSLSILTMFVLLVGVLAGLNKITTKKASNSAANHASQIKATREAVTTAVSKLPMTFEPNRGQTDSRVKYVARSAGYNVFLTGPSSAVMVFQPPKVAKAKADRLTMNLAGANGSAQAHAEAATGGVSNYYIDSDRSKWLEGIPNYAQVRYSDVYPGVDVVYQGDNNHFRYDFVVKPGADPKSIRMSYEGAKGLRLNDKGEVVVAMNNGDMIGSKPYVYQEIAGKKHVVDGGYVLTAQNDVQFQLGAYDATRSLVIDPGNTYATYFGGGTALFNTTITGVAMDATGVYFVGTTNTLAFDANLLGAGTTDALVGSFNLSLSTAGVKTFIGGSFNNDEGNGIAINSSNIVVVGNTNSGINFPGVSTAGVVTQPLKLTNSGEINLNQHAWIAVLTKAGASPVTSILAGLGFEQANAVAIDKTTKIHMVGQTASPDFLTNTKAPATSAQPTLQSDNQDNAFYVTLPTALTSLGYGTFLGGFNYDRANAIAVDSNGFAYVTGVSTSWTGAVRTPPMHQAFPIQPPQPCAGGNTAACIPVQNPPKPPLTINPFTGGVHAFVAAFNSTAANTSTAPTLLYSLPLGGDISAAESDIGTSIAVDANSTVYVGGNSCANATVTSQLPFGITAGTPTAGLNVACGAGATHVSQGAGPGVGGVAHNVVFTAPAVLGTNPGTAAGPGVVASIPVTNGGVGYTSAPTVTIDPPSLPLGTQATATANIVAGSVTSVTITNQGSGYTVPPAITFSGGGGVGASASVVVGPVVLGAPAPGANAEDGWVVAVSTPGSFTTTYNGVSLLSGAPGDIALPPGASFPAFIYATLVNGDEVNGNGSGAALPANAVSQVTGLASDSGINPTGQGTAGPLGNIYVSGGSSNTSAGQTVLIRRRINTAGFDPFNVVPQSPFLRNVGGTTPWPTAQVPAIITALGDVVATAAPVATVTVATGVAFDITTNRSCIGATISQTLPAGSSTLFTTPPATVTGTYPGGADDGLLACVPFLNDTTVSGISGGAPGTQGSTITFSMQAGTTPTSTSPFAPLVTAATNTTTITITNPNTLVSPAILGPNVFYSPGGVAGPPAGSAAHVPWLRLSNAVNAAGSVVTASLLDQGFINDPNHLNPASQLDPGFYQATFTVIPGAGADNAGIPVAFTVNLLVTGNVYTNTSVGGGTPANTTVQLLEGKGWTDVGLNDKLINIPIVSAVPINSPSFSNIVFDAMRDANGNVVYSNTAPANATAYPVLGMPSLTGAVKSVDFTPGSNYPPNTPTSPAQGPVTNPLTFSAPVGGGTTAQGYFNVGPGGHVTSIVITNGGSGYQNPPSVTFPLPLAGGTQAVATNVTITGASAGLNQGPFGSVNLRPTSGLTPGTIGCGSTPFAGSVAPRGLTLENACYIQVDLPANILSGAPSGNYTGTFYLTIPNDVTNNEPSEAPESSPPSPQPIIGFSPVGSTTMAFTTPPATPTVVPVTITVIVGTGSLIVNSPWLSNIAPFIVNPPTVPPMMPLAPFAVPYGYTGTVNSSNNNVPFIQGVTGNNPNNGIHTISIDSKNLLQPQGTFLTTITPGINANAQLAYTESTGCPDDDNACVNPLPGIVLPIATCTTASPAIPAGVLQVTPTGILPASNAAVTTTDVTFSIVNPSTLAPGFYASTVTIAALTNTGNAVLDGTGAPVAVAVPVCLTVGNNLEYEVFDTNTGTAIASGPNPMSGFLFMEAGLTPQVLLDEVFAIGPSQNANLPVPGGPLFAPGTDRLEVPATMTPSALNPIWATPPTFPSGAGDQKGTACHGTQTANACTPMYRLLTVAPPQSTPPSTGYMGGFTVTPTYALGLPAPLGLLGAAPNPLSAILPIEISSGPTVITNPPATSNPLGNIVSGVVTGIIINGGGTLYTTPPAITFAGGCVNEPTAQAILNPTTGAVTRIVLTTLGGGCSTQPIVTIAPPTTPGGTQATATAIISDAVVNLTFTEQVGQLNTIPNQLNIQLLPSDTTTHIFSFGPLFFNSASVQTWLDFSPSGCGGAIPFNPNQAEPGFFNGCQVQFNPEPLVVSSLAPGTYTAWMVIAATPPAQPAFTAVVVTLNVTNGVVVPCQVNITDSTNNSSGTTLSVNGTSTAGYWPSNPLTLTVSTTGTCPSFTTAVANPSNAGVAPFVSIASGGSGAGSGTITYNAGANTLLSARSNAITVTAGTSSATYTVNEPASADTLLNREVRAIYQRVLGREADTGGFNYWTCLAPAPAPCANLGVSGLGLMVDGFVTSWEGEYTGYQTIAVYQAVLGRAPTFAEWNAARATFVANDNPNGWTAAAQALANTLVNSNEYANKFGSPTNTGNVVTNLFKNALNRAPTAPELATGTATIQGGGTSGVYAELLNIWGTSQGLNPTQPPTLIFTSAAYQATTNTDYIYYLYYSILGRDVDAGGFAFWLNVANSFGQGILFNNQAGRIAIEGNGAPGSGFVGSTEFQNTFNH